MLEMYIFAKILLIKFKAFSISYPMKFRLQICLVVDVDGATVVSSFLPLKLNLVNGHKLYEDSLSTSFSWALKSGPFTIGILSNP